MDLNNQVIARQIPANIAAEQMLLGAVIINNEALNEISEFLRAEHFYEPLHQKVYTGICHLLDKGMSASIISLESVLTKHEEFKQAGGKQYILQLTTVAMSIIDVREYAKIVHDLALKRGLINIGEKIVNTAYESDVAYPANTQIEEAESSLFQLASEGLTEKGFDRLSSSLSTSLNAVVEAMKNPDKITGTSTGLIDLDHKLLGLHNSDLIILAGRPSMGKTAVAINLAVNAAMDLKKKYENQNKSIPSVGIFSLEMSAEQLANRILSMRTAVDGFALRSGKLSAEHYDKLRQEATALNEIPIFIDDSPALSIAAIRTRARRLHRKHNLGLLVIDYLQLIHGSSNSDNRVLEIGEITQGLKSIAKELSIPVIALSQLSRAVEQRDDKRPMLSDLRESGSIEQDADIVMFLYREEYYLSRKEPEPGTPKHQEWFEKLNEVHNLLEIIVAKHRNGAIGTVRVFYDPPLSKINNLEKRY